MFYKRLKGLSGEWQLMDYVLQAAEGPEWGVAIHRKVAQRTLCCRQ